jgi:hypothetical protein
VGLAITWDPEDGGRLQRPSTQPTFIGLVTHCLKVA